MNNTDMNDDVTQSGMDPIWGNSSDTVGVLSRNSAQQDSRSDVTNLFTNVSHSPALKDAHLLASQIWSNSSDLSSFDGNLASDTWDNASDTTLAPNTWQSVTDFAQEDVQSLASQALSNVSDSFAQEGAHSFSYGAWNNLTDLSSSWSNASDFISTIEANHTVMNETGVYWCENLSALPHDEHYIEFYETAQFITGLILYPCICIPGLIGNCLTLIVFSDKNLRTSTNAFLSALAVADSIKLINDVLYFCTILLLRTDDDMGNKAFGYLYPYAHFIFNMSACVSSWLTVSVAVERYIMVCHPTRARNVCNRNRAIVVCAVVFLVMTSLALPSAFRYKTVKCVQPEAMKIILQVELTEMWKNESFVNAYTWGQNLLRSIVPLLVLIVLNSCIVSALRKTRANKRNSSRHRVTVMMIIVILVFLVCITPDVIMSTVFGLGYTEANNLVKGVREFSDTLLAINAATNFIIYCLFNKMFLQSCKNLFCKTTIKKKWQTELDESMYKRLSEKNNSNNNGSPPRL